MMVLNELVRARYYWNDAEWVRTQFQRPLQVEHRDEGANRIYRVHQHPGGGRTFAHWPFTGNIDFSSGGRSICDVLLYRLGDDGFSAKLLPDRFKGSGSGAFDGLVIVSVKLEFTFHTQAFIEIRSRLEDVMTSVEKAFNNKFFAAGTLSGADPLKAPFSEGFSRALLLFQPRILVPTVPVGDDEPTKQYFRDMNVPDAAGYTAAVTAITTRHRRHFNITTVANGNSRWATGRNLTLSFGDDWVTVFADFFCDMLNIPRAQRGATGSYNALVRSVLPGANVG
jgi:hypothetical protein